MNALILILTFFCFSTGFSGLVLALLLFLRYKNRILLLYTITLGAWSLNLFLIRILDILQLQFWNISELDSWITALLSHVSWGVFSFFLILMILSILNKSLNKVLEAWLVLSSLFLMIPFELGIFSDLSSGFKTLLQYLQVALHFLILYYAAFQLKKIVSTLTKKRIRKMYRRMVMVLFILYPILMLDLIPATQSRYPFGLGIYPLFYFLVNLFFLRFLSNFIYFPKLDRNSPEAGTRKKINLYSLTDREQQIADMLILGKSYKQISEELFIALETVKTHVSNIYSKVQVRNKIELIEAMKGL